MTGQRCANIPSGISCGHYLSISGWPQLEHLRWGKGKNDTTVWLRRYGGNWVWMTVLSPPNLLNIHKLAHPEIVSKFGVFEQLCKPLALDPPLARRISCELYYIAW